ncbi:hypothetical protein ELY33_04985 [Vreelandella andesensis]|uniref:Uncharacterized protein n=1 Tax=Vreelandella andesensis TaxID=447567 RepID=A0A3S0W648_9GAMM|nr:hypothetical protein [Halomonas andesensis]RUR32737.1 hypothetical protein ELY33_04985 [Halomonas andesensis]
MGITEQHYEAGTRLLGKHHPSTDSHRDTYRRGYLDAVAWHLAGRPDTDEDYYRYTPGTVSRDAWAYGWTEGQQFASSLGKTSA